MRKDYHNLFDAALEYAEAYKAQNEAWHSWRIDNAIERLKEAAKKWAKDNA